MNNDRKDDAVVKNSVYAPQAEFLIFESVGAEFFLNPKGFGFAKLDFSFKKQLVTFLKDSFAKANDSNLTPTYLTPLLKKTIVEQDFSVFVNPVFAKSFLSLDKVNVKFSLTLPRAFMIKVFLGELDFSLLEFNLLEINLVERIRKFLFGSLVEQKSKWFLKPDPFTSSVLFPIFDLSLVEKSCGLLASEAEFKDKVTTLGFSAALLLDKSSTLEISNTAASPSVVLQEVYVEPSECLIQQVQFRHLPNKYSVNKDSSCNKDFSYENLGAASNELSNAGLAAKNIVDLTSLYTFTIDSDSSLDLDDALSCLPPDEEGNIKVLVHISDVSSFVLEGSSLDDYARENITSIYFPSKNIPMLPRAFSENMLSLLPNQKRNALTVSFLVSPSGSISNIEVVESFIVSNKRISYKDAALLLKANEYSKEYEAFADEDLFASFKFLQQAAFALQKEREKRGGFPLNTEDAFSVKVLDGLLFATEKTSLEFSYKLVELLMVATNESVASWLEAKGVSFINRTQLPITKESIFSLKEIFSLYNESFPLEIEELTASSLSVLFKYVTVSSNPSFQKAVALVLMSLMPKAVYSLEKGHFSLGSKIYTQFTSPIRRYADLTVHRCVKKVLHQESFSDSYDAMLLDACTLLNNKTILTRKIERELLKSFWLFVFKNDESFSCKKFDAFISGFSEKGLYVTLKNYSVSAFIPFKSLPGFVSPKGPFAAVSSLGDKFILGKNYTVSLLDVDPNANSATARIIF